MTRRLPHIIALAAVLILALSGTALAKKPVRYSGKTKEGAKITFKLDKGWIRGLKTRAPMSCGSAQGGNPKASIALYWPPFDFKVSRKIKYKDTSGITTHYNITTHRKAHGVITGKLESNWSLLASNTFGGYHILVCEMTSSFKAKPKK